MVRIIFSSAAPVTTVYLISPSLLLISNIKFWLPCLLVLLWPLALPEGRRSSFHSANQQIQPKYQIPILFCLIEIWLAMLKLQNYIFLLPLLCFCSVSISEASVHEYNGEKFVSKGNAFVVHGGSEGIYSSIAADPQQETGSGGDSYIR